MKAYSNTWDNIYSFKKSRYSKNVTVIVVMDEKVLVHHKKINILWTEKYFGISWMNCIRKLDQMRLAFY